MKANATESEAPENVIALQQPAPVVAPEPKRQPASEVEPRFKIKEFKNPSGDVVYRVEGYKADNKTRVRLNFAENGKARAKQLELETEYLTGAAAKPEFQHTRLTPEQIQIAEAIFPRFQDPKEALVAVDHWFETGKKNSVTDSPRLDDAWTKFSTWLDTECKLRELSRKNLKRRVELFINSVPNLRTCDVTPETIDDFLSKREVSPKSKDNDRRAVSRFFAWCMERKQGFTNINPCRAVKVEQPEDEAPPAILSLEECRALLMAAGGHRKGRLVPYVALCLFGGLRPDEAAAVSLNQINLKDGELRLEANQTKTKRPRVVELCKTLKAWLRAYKRRAVYPANWRRDFDAIKAKAGFGNPNRMSKALAATREKWKEWPVDVMRHTAISHYFRKTGSYGLAAEQFGNSEAIIKAHYGSRVSEQDTKKFYALLPKKKTKAKKGAKAKKGTKGTKGTKRTR